MHDLNLDLLGGQLEHRLRQRFLRTLDIGLDDQCQRLARAFGHLLEHGLELGSLLTGQLDVAELALTKQRNLARLALVDDAHELFAGRRHFGQTLDFDRNRWPGFGDRFAGLIEHGSHPAIGRACQHHVAALERAGLDQNGRHRTTALVESRFDDQTLGRCIDCGKQLEHFGLQQHILEQVIDTLTGARRHRHERRFAAELLGHDLLRHQFLLHPVGIGFGLVDLVHRHDDRHTGRLGMVDCLDRLRHDAIVGRDHQDHDIGGLGAAGAHRGKRFVARGIEEGDHPTRRLDVVSADVLGDATGFASGDLGATDIVEQRGFTVVDVAHHGHDRGTRKARRLGMRLGFLEHGLGIVKRRGNRGMAQRLIDGDHLAHLHHQLDDLGRLDRHLVGQISHRDGFRNMDLANNGFGCRCCLHR